MKPSKGNPSFTVWARATFPIKEVRSQTKKIEPSNLVKMGKYQVYLEEFSPDFVCFAPSQHLQPKAVGSDTGGSWQENQVVPFQLPGGGHTERPGGRSVRLGHRQLSVGELHKGRILFQQFTIHLSIILPAGMCWGLSPKKTKSQDTPSIHRMWLILSQR